MMDDLVDLLGELAVELGDDGLNRPDRVGVNQAGPGSACWARMLHRTGDGFAGLVRPGL